MKRNKSSCFQASDIYLKMAIGNAPWPIGVDQVGIHMRPSRETISMRYVAHVLNDETQRKFIQGIFHHWFQICEIENSLL